MKSEGCMPPVSGILETALYVEDTARASEFYEKVLGFRVMTRSHRLSALHIRNRQYLLLFRKGGSLTPIIEPGGTVPPTDGDGNLHLAFAINQADFETWKSWLESNGVVIESVKNWESGGRSIYFRDLDGHVIELGTPGLWPIES